MRVVIMTISSILIGYYLLFFLEKIAKKIVEKRTQSLEEHFEDNAALFENSPNMCYCQKYNIKDVLRKDGTTHTQRLCFPEREEVK